MGAPPGQPVLSDLEYSPKTVPRIDGQREAPIGQPWLTDYRSSDVRASRPGRTNGRAVAASGLAGPRSGVRAVPENTGQGVARLGFRNQGAARHRAGMAWRANGAPRRDRWAASGRRSAGKVEGERVTSGRRGPGRARLGDGRREPDVGENPLDDGRVLDRGDEA